MINNLPPVDIISFLHTATAIIAFGAILSFWAGIRSIRTSNDLPYYKMRRKQLERGWQQLFLGSLLTGVALVLLLRGETTAYRYMQITATPSLTPSQTIAPSRTAIPTRTASATVTLTPAESYTPTITPTPYMPMAIEAQFQGLVTPPADAIISPLTFCQGFDINYRAINPNTVFRNPVGHLYGLFSYDKMADGVQWTALWYRAGELVYYETQVWNSGGGGFGFTDWAAQPEEWLPGLYQVQIFIGLEFKVLGEFRVEGGAVTATASQTITLTPTVTLTPTKTSPASTTPTRTPSITPWPTQTRKPTITTWPTSTAAPSNTPWPTNTRYPTITPWPTLTRTPTPR